jgi:hypothetical protein
LDPHGAPLTDSPGPVRAGRRDERLDGLLVTLARPETCSQPIRPIRRSIA